MVGLLSAEMNDTRTGIRVTIEANTLDEYRVYWFDLSFDEDEFNFYSLLDTLGVNKLDELTNVFCHFEFDYNILTNIESIVIMNLHNSDREYWWWKGFHQDYKSKKNRLRNK